MPSEFGEEGEQEIKDAVKSTGSSYTWEELSKYNERHNVHVAVRGKVSLALLFNVCLLNPRVYAMHNIQCPEIPVYGDSMGPILVEISYTFAIKHHNSVNYRDLTQRVSHAINY